MSEQGHTDGRAITHIESDRPHPARMYDYVLGGQTNFTADRELAEQMGQVLPGGIEFGRSLARHNRAFMARVVRFLAGEAGIRQFLDIGAGIPAYDNTHDVAQAIVPEARVVYVDCDAIVLAHAHAMLRSAPQGACDFVQADFRDPDTILSEAATTLDFDQPVGLMLIALLHLIDTDVDSHGVLGHLLEALPSDSYVALSHFTADIFTEEMNQMAVVYRGAGESMTLRNREQVGGFFDGLELAEPGVVLIDEWRPTDETDQLMPIYGGVARKP